ncbi:uncharacterized protein LOC119098655 [Pollicipes pollicipes]|uniref:uncharacterized protein LOC119098655 n=1 Tax=Pollicipes pollicipes TaxID=41117 RepID=UPI0018851E4E|nr:uncharacterized protein LOC119098655 [Pollicipes pollicipes]
MISFLVPPEERGFNLNNAVPRNGVGYQNPVTNGRTDSIIRRDLTSGQVTNEPHRPGRTSPNNNSCRVPTSLTLNHLDNRPAAGLSPRQIPLALTRDLPMMDDSSSDDTTTGSLAPLHADDASDEVMTPSTENTHGPSFCEQKRRAPATTASTRSGKLKRVSFGSSKGSMVETLIYDYEPVHTLREEEPFHWPARRPGSRHSCTFTTSTPVSTLKRSEEEPAQKATSRVRVTYYESKRPLCVSGSDASEASERRPARPPAHTPLVAVATEMPTTYIVSSVDAGWENPFRPGGELSKEADQIVRAIQSGRPLDASLDAADGPAPPPAAGNGHAGSPANGLPAGEPAVALQTTALQTAVPPSPPSPPATLLATQQPGTVEVRHSVVTPEGAAQVERVALKKKPRGRCCVIQ